ncbi:hypothetical protein M413DRAFT_14670 [Hebeloma cylindrosporum]|uniref:Uncharacterized protein n=1 Tax=Hebeloma cylindrosporum TaxID=76867 RepID=A0A0C2XB65_HEBCY|nr:hypothetical protein M413DRAFT_14670 [Hebeloma cylindrosporum h7]
MGHQLKGQKGQGVWQQEDENEFDGEEYEGREEAEDGEEYAGREEAEDADDEGEDFQHRSGPIPESVKDQAYRLHREQRKCDASYPGSMECISVMCRVVNGRRSSWRNIAQKLNLLGIKMEWYRERLQAKVRETKKSGKFDITIGHYAKLVTNMSVKIYQESGLILFGYLIDTMGNPNGTNSSVAWGGAPPYKELRMKKAATITQQTIDYVTMFRSLEMDKVEQIQYQPAIRKPNEGKRDYHSRIFAEYQCMDLDTWLGERQCNSRCPGDPSFKLKQLTGKEVDQAVAARQKAMKCPDDAEWDSVIHIISWSDVSDECSRSLEDQSNMPLVIDSDGKVLLQVKHSKRYKQQMGGKKSQASNNEGNEDGESESEEAPVTRSGGCPSRREPSPTPSGSEDEPQACNVSAQRSANVEPEQQEPESRNISVQRMRNVEREQREPEPHNLSVQHMRDAEPEHPRSDDHQRPTKRLCITQDVDSRRSVNRQPPTVPHSTRPRQQPPNIPHSTRPSHPVPP